MGHGLIGKEDYMEWTVIQGSLRKERNLEAWTWNLM